MEPISQTPHALSRLLKPHNEIQGQEVAWEGRATGVLATVPLGTLSPRLVMLVLVEGTHVLLETYKAWTCPKYPTQI